jgi:hypothetical protein
LYKYKVKINQDKLEELKKQLAPSKSWWGLVGIIVFFFIPEIIAYFKGDEIVAYFKVLENSSSNVVIKYLYKQLESLGRNSYFNITLGLLFVVWFFKLKFKK